MYQRNVLSSLSSFPCNRDGTRIVTLENSAPLQSPQFSISKPVLKSGSPVPAVGKWDTLTSQISGSHLEKQGEHPPDRVAMKDKLDNVFLAHSLARSRDLKNKKKVVLLATLCQVGGKESIHVLEPIIQKHPVYFH